MTAFAPALAGGATTVSLNVTSTTGNVVLAGVAAGQSQCEVTNTGAKWAYVAFGGSTVTVTAPNGATGGGYPIGPGQTKVISIGTNATSMAAICDSGNTTTVYATMGYGDS